MTKVLQTWSEWLKNSRFSYMNDFQKEQTLRWLLQVKNKVLQRAYIKSGDILIDIGTGTGLLAFGAYEKSKDLEKIIASDISQDCLDECSNIARNLEIEDKFEFLKSDSKKIDIPDNSVDVVVMRSVLVHVVEKKESIKEFYRILKEGMVEKWFNIPAGSGNMSMKQRFRNFVNEVQIDKYIEEVKNQLTGKTITLESKSAYISATK